MKLLPLFEGESLLERLLPVIEEIFLNKVISGEFVHISIPTKYEVYLKRVHLLDGVLWFNGYVKGLATPQNKDIIDSFETMRKIWTREMGDTCIQDEIAERLLTYFNIDNKGDIIRVFLHLRSWKADLTKL